MAVIHRVSWRHAVKLGVERMGLAITIGVLSDLLENDPEGVEWMEEDRLMAELVTVAPVRRRGR